jgi:hypothetical protein
MPPSLPVQEKVVKQQNSIKMYMNNATVDICSGREIMGHRK